MADLAGRNFNGNGNGHNRNGHSASGNGNGNGRSGSRYGPLPAPAVPAAHTRAHDIDLREYAQILWRRKLVIVAAALVAVAASVGISQLTTPVYAATSEVLLGARVVESPFDPLLGIRLDAARTLANEMRVVVSQPVTDTVTAQLGRHAEPSVATIAGTDVIRITARSTVPARAADVANAYANAYIEFRRTRSVDDLINAGKQVQAKVTELQPEIDQAPAGSPQRQALVDQQSLFKQKLDQLQVDAALKTGGAELVTPATASTDPVEPQPLKSGATALGLGLVLGVAIAFLIEFLDDTVKSRQDVNRVAPDIAVLGLIPTIAHWRPRKTRVISVEDPNSGAAEAYRTLRTSLQFYGLDRRLGVLQITSAGALEGKSATAANLGVALALAGSRVVVACCDLRRPRIHEFYGLDSSVGLTSVLLGQVPLTGAVQAVDGVPRLSVLASGPLPPNPSEILASPRFEEVVAELRAHADVVILDCPPVLPVSDALAVSGRADATLVVSVAGQTTRKDLGRALELLRQVDAPVVGAVLNGVDETGSYGYGYYRTPEKGKRREPAAATTR